MNTVLNHYAEITPVSGKFSFWLQGSVIARSTRVLKLTEFYGDKQLAPIMYLPVEDLKKQYLSNSDLVTHCPLKGKAHYWHLTLGKNTWENLLWYYPHPSQEVISIQGYAAFSPTVVNMEID